MAEVLKVKWNDKVIERDIPNYLSNYIKTIVINIVRRVKQIAPVKSGKLRGSIDYEELEKRKDLIKYSVGTDVDYAIFLEYGTSRMSPKPFMRPVMKQFRG